LGRRRDHGGRRRRGRGHRRRRVGTAAGGDAQKTGAAARGEAQKTNDGRSDERRGEEDNTRAGSHVDRPSTRLAGIDQIRARCSAGDSWGKSRCIMNDPLVVAGRRFASRLVVGTGKYKSVEETERAVDASGAELVTVAVRRVDLADRSTGSLMSLL